MIALINFSSAKSCYIFNNFIFSNSGLKNSKTLLRDLDGGQPKSSSQWANFLVELGCPRPLGACVVATPIFPQKIINENKHNNLDVSSPISLIDNSPLKSHNYFQLSYCQETYAQIWDALLICAITQAKFNMFE